MCVIYLVLFLLKSFSSVEIDRKPQKNGRDIVEMVCLLTLQFNV